MRLLSVLLQTRRKSIFRYHFNRRFLSFYRSSAASVSLSAGLAPRKMINTLRVFQIAINPPARRQRYRATSDIKLLRASDSRLDFVRDPRVPLLGRPSLHR